MHTGTCPYEENEALGRDWRLLGEVTEDGQRAPLESVRDNGEEVLVIVDSLDRGRIGNCVLSRQVLVIVDSLDRGSIGNCGLCGQGKYW